jgi:uncharacterized protein YndB with AHSA1/START domain
MTTARDEYGRFLGPGEVQFVRVLPGPIERLWDYLTKSELRGKWLATGPMELQAGGAFELCFDHSTLSAEPTPGKYQGDGSAHKLQGKVLRCEPPRLLSYTWYCSEITFELFPEADEVRLVVTHRRLGDDPAALAEVGGGWHAHLGVLEDQLQGRAPRPFWTTHAQAEQEYLRRLNRGSGQLP